MPAEDLDWLRTRVLAESPESILDVGGYLAERLAVGPGPEIYATGQPAHPDLYDRVITRGRWPKVDVVVAELYLRESADLDKLDEVWDRLRKAARKTVLVHVAFGQGLAFASDAAVHRVLPGIVASDGRGLYAVTALGRKG